MADLADLGVRSQENRAQLILVTAFALAAILLGLAIIINSAIFTENLATRSETVEATEALEYRHSVEQFTGELIGVANEHNHTSHDDIRENVSDGILDAGNYSSIQQIERGAALSLALDENNITDGARIFQNDESDFTNNASDDDWTLGNDVESTRAFELQITEFNTTHITVDGDFYVEVDDGVDEWELRINETDLTTTRDSEEESCSLPDISTVDEIRIDVTDGTVNGDPCPALEDTGSGDPMQFGAGVDDKYDLSFENGAAIEKGNYSLVVTGDDFVDGSGIDSERNRDDYGETDGPGDAPYIRPAMYSAEVELEYETARVAYETVLRVAPGEPR